MKEYKCNLCGIGFVCKNGMWLTNCFCEKNRQGELAMANELATLRELCQMSADVIDDDLRNRPARHPLGNLYSRLKAALNRGTP